MGGGRDIFLGDGRFSDWDLVGLFFGLAFRGTAFLIAARSITTCARIDPFLKGDMGLYAEYICVCEEYAPYQLPMFALYKDPGG